MSSKNAYFVGPHSSTSMKHKCSIIGSFRKYYREVTDIITFFEENNIQVLSPKKSEIINPSDEFVLFSSDNLSHENHEIQLIALNRILHSDFIFVCNPNGYIGKTTSYEIGRIVERKIPIFFQETPLDLPIFLHDNAVFSKEAFVSALNRDSTLLLNLPFENSSEFSIKLNENLFSTEYYDYD